MSLYFSCRSLDIEPNLHYEGTWKPYNDFMKSLLDPNFKPYKPYYYLEKYGKFRIIEKK
jgi:hypothetical protein